MRDTIYLDSFTWKDPSFPAPFVKRGFLQCTLDKLFLLLWQNIWPKQLKEEFTLDYSLRLHPQWWQCHDDRMRELVTLYHSQESERNGCWYSVPFLLSIHNLSPWGSVTHIQGGFSLHDLTILETFLQTQLELRFHGDYKSSHVDSED